jgi:hypothetical protein
MKSRRVGLDPFLTMDYVTSPSSIPIDFWAW